MWDEAHAGDEVQADKAMQHGEGGAGEVEGDDPSLLLSMMGDDDEDMGEEV